MMAGLPIPLLPEVAVFPKIKAKIMQALRRLGSNWALYK